MAKRAGRQVQRKRSERLCQIVQSVVLLERAGDSPTVSKIASRIGMRVAPNLRELINSLAEIGMFQKIETKHWNGVQKFIYKINPAYISIPDLQLFANACKDYGYQIPLFGFDSSITHDKDTKP